MNDDKLHMDFAKSTVGDSKKRKKKSVRGNTKTNVKNIADNGIQSFEQLQGLSESLANTSGIYSRFILYMSSLLTYDYILYPVLPPKLKKSDSKKLNELFFEVATQVDKVNPKFWFPQFAKSIIKKGEVYTYEIEDKKGIVYKIIPSEYCKRYYMEDGIYRYLVDMSKFDEVSILEYPKELQSAYLLYTNGNTDRLIEGKWSEVSNKGIGLALDGELEHSLPFFSYLLSDLVELDGVTKDMDFEIDKLNNVKLIHSELPLDDKGKPTIPFDIAKIYHAALQDNLPENMKAFVNPFKTKEINLHNTTDRKNSVMQKKIDYIYTNSGISSLLFNNDNATGEALKRSIEVDCMIAYSFLVPIFTNFINYKLNKINKGALQYKVSILDISYFNRQERIAQIKDSINYGASRFLYLSCLGLSPLQSYSTLMLEQEILNIDELMQPKQMASTISNKDGKGRKSNEEKGEEISDSTDKVKGYE